MKTPTATFYTAPFNLMRGVKGSARVEQTSHARLADAKRHAERWSRSNSIGSYYAQIIDANGKVVERYNLDLAGAVR